MHRKLQSTPRSVASIDAASAVLLSSAGPHGVEVVLRGIESGQFDWGHLLALAQREGATGVVWRQLRASRLPSVPDEYRLRFERLAAIASFHASHVEDRLRETLAAMADERVPVVLLKGAALAKTTYRSFSDRPMGDIDLLIDAADMDRALRAAQRARWLEGRGFFSPAAYAPHQHGAPLQDASGTRLQLELHTELFSRGHPFRITASDVRREATAVQGESTLVRAPSRLHRLLHVAIHFGWSHQMRFGCWRMIRDVSALTHDDPEVWEGLVRCAKEHRAATCCYWTLRIARDLGRVEVPDETLSELAPYVGDRKLNALARHLELQVLPNVAQCPSEQLRAMLWLAAIRPNRSRHGTARPYDPSVDPARQRTKPTVVWRLKNQARSVATWGRYLSRVLMSVGAVRVT